MFGHEPTAGAKAAAATLGIDLSSYGKKFLVQALATCNTIDFGVVGQIVTNEAASKQWITKRDVTSENVSRD